ncbi:ABC transporter permease [Marinicrinis lubricantis]|uniref:ABC transporter permease n=1 Tax=Marinicrinis lubricantis TaxID=2086470 RepID=A0ABW1IQG5_9BACL
MKAYYQIAWNEIKILFRLRTTWLLLFLLPLLLIFILGSALAPVFKPESDLMGFRLAVYIEETSLANTDEMKQMLVNESALGVTLMKTENQLTEEVESGKADFGLMIPADSWSQLAAGREGVWQMVPGQNSLHNEVGLFYTNMLLRNMQNAAAVQMNSATDWNVKASTSPVQEHVILNGLNESSKDHSAVQYYAAAMLVMFMLYAGMSASISMAQEREEQTLTRLSAAPVKPLSIVAGKLTGNIIISMVQALVIIGVGSAAFDVYWGKEWLGMGALCLLMILCSNSLALILAFTVKSPKLIGTFFSLLIIIMTFLSGGFTPEVFTNAAQFTLSYWASDGMMKLMLDADWPKIVPHLTVLGSILVVLSIISGILYKKVGYHA